MNTWGLPRHVIWSVREGWVEMKPSLRFQTLLPIALIESVKGMATSTHHMIYEGETHQTVSDRRPAALADASGIARGTA
jgi:hypothetical protein